MLGSDNETVKLYPDRPSGALSSVRLTVVVGPMASIVSSSTSTDSNAVAIPEPITSVMITVTTATPIRF